MAKSGILLDPETGEQYYPRTLWDLVDGKPDFSESLSVFSSTVNGLVPMSGSSNSSSYYLAGDGSWTALPTNLSQFTDDIDAANKINTIQVNGTNLSISDKTVNITSDSLWTVPTQVNTDTGYSFGNDHVYWVIALATYSPSTSVGQGSWGMLTAMRNNYFAGYSNESVRFKFHPQYNNNELMSFAYFADGNYLTPCTFTYNGTKYAGFVFNKTTANITGNLYYQLFPYSDFTPFVVAYYYNTTSNPTIINDEVYNSLSTTDSTLVEQKSYVHVTGMPTTATTTLSSTSKSISAHSITSNSVSASGSFTPAGTIAQGTPSTVSVNTSYSSTTKKLATTTITGVSGSTTASQVTVSSSSFNNMSASVSGETLVFDTSSVSVPSVTATEVTVPKAAIAAITVATGSLADSDSNGGIVVTGITSGGTKTVLTSVGAPTFTGTEGTVSVTGTANIEIANHDNLAIPTSATTTLS